MKEPLHVIRARLRRQRAALAPERVRHDSLIVCARVRALDAYRRARHVAGYIGARGEIDPMPLLHLAHAEGKHCYLPVLHPFLPGRMYFAEWRPGAPLRVGRFGIPEPEVSIAHARTPRTLDLVLMPLLGFDERCNRLGMGGGFYDRAFAFVRYRRGTRPVLVGLAHEQQQLRLPAPRPHDIRPDHLLTPARHLRCPRT